MIRLRNTVTGVVVSVSDEKADRLGSVWSRVVPAPPVVAPGRATRGPKKADSK